MSDMTEEEVIKNLKALLLRTDITDEYGDMEDMTPYEDAVDVAIKAIQVLEDIKAEIDITARDFDKFEDSRRVRGLWIALDIIDRHMKGVSE